MFWFLCLKVVLEVDIFPFFFFSFIFDFLIFLRVVFRTLPILMLAALMFTWLPLRNTIADAETAFPDLA